MDNNNSFKYYNLPELWDQPPTQSQLEVAEATINSIPSDVRTILDVGSGNGVITNLLIGHYDRVCAIDISEEALKHVKAEKHIGSIDRLPFNDDEFDLILISDVLEHLPPDVFEQGVKELMRVAKNYILIVTPFEERLEFGQMSCVTCSSQFHVNHHIRSVTYPLIEETFESQFSVEKLAFAGDEWMHMPEYASSLKSLFRYSNGWELAICPLCGTLQNGQPRQEVSKEFYASTIDKYHLVAESERQSVFRYNEAVFLLRKMAAERKHIKLLKPNATSISVKTNSVLSNFRIVNDGKWNIDVSNPFHSSRNTKYFGSKPYMVINERQNISEHVVATTSDCQYRLVGPKKQADNHAVFVIPKFTNGEFDIEVTYQDVSTESLMLNVYDREKSYINLGVFGGAADGAWKTQKFTVGRVACPPEGYIFELTSPGLISEEHPIRYISINGVPQVISSLECVRAEDGSFSFDLSGCLSDLRNSNCYLLFDDEGSGDRASSVYFKQGDLEVKLSCLPMSPGSYIVELSSEVICMLNGQSDDEDRKTAIDFERQLEKANSLDEKEIKLLEAQKQLIREQDTIRKFESEMEKYKKALQNLESQLISNKKENQELQGHVERLEEKVSTIKNMSLLAYIRNRKKW